MATLHKLLCDPTSIKSICNSNHTQEDVDPSESKYLFDLLKLNSNVDKAKVASNKILKYYFVGDFGVTPFENMPVSVVREVICWIKLGTKLSAIFRLLKFIPQLQPTTIGSVVAKSKLFQFQVEGQEVSKYITGGLP
jgi:hypothetical protein